MFKYSVFADEVTHDLEEQVLLLKEYGFTNVDLRSIYRTPILDWKDQDAKDYARKFTDEGITILSLGSSIGKLSINEDFELEKKRFDKLLDINEYFKSKYIRIFSYYNGDDCSLEEVYPLLLQRIMYLVEKAKAAGVILLIENETNTIADDPKIAKKLLTDIGSEYLGVVFDTGNYVFSGIDTLEAYNILKEYVMSFHIKDVVLKYNIHVPSGLGDAHISELVDALLLNDFSGEISFEPHLGRYVGVDNQGEVLENVEWIQNAFDKKTQFSMAFQAFEEIVKSRRRE